jgi:hypothetical protein
MVGQMERDRIGLIVVNKSDDGSCLLEDIFSLDHQAQRLGFRGLGLGQIPVDDEAPLTPFAVASQINSQHQQLCRRTIITRTLTTTLSY